MTHADIEAAIRYETAPGEHTYHLCDCGRGNARGEQCAQCWREALDRANAQVGQPQSLPPTSGTA